MMYSFDEKMKAYSSFFVESTAAFEEMEKIFSRLVPRALQLLETYGTIKGEDDAGEAENAQLSRLAILERDFHEYFKNYSEKVGALRDELDQKIEFAQALLEGIEAGE